MSASDRIESMLSYLNINAKTFSERLGYNRPQIIYDIQKGKTKSISNDLAIKITSVFSDINRTWLLTGEGEMLNGVNSIIPTISYTKGVPYYNVDFLGGFDLVLNDQTTTPEYLIDFKKYNDATCWCNVTGHSMEPEIHHGDIIALRQIDDFSFFPMGEVYAIVTTNGMRTIKRIGPSSNPNCYSLIPTNKSPEYGIQDLPKAMIKSLFQVLGCMKRL